MRIEAIISGLFLFVGYVSFNTILQYIFYTRTTKNKITTSSQRDRDGADQNNRTTLNNDHNRDLPTNQRSSTFPTSGSSNSFSDHREKEKGSWKIQDREDLNLGDSRWWFPFYMGITNIDKSKPRGKYHSVFARSVKVE